MKIIFTCIFFVFVFSAAKTQEAKITWKPPPHYPFIQLYQLDSLGNSSSISKYFGGLYFNFLTHIEKQLEPADSSTKELVRRFEKTFAQFYIDACASVQTHQPILINEWKTYFSDSSLQPIQYKLLGANAHLNGGLWQALTKSFSKSQMDSLKNEFVIFKRSLNITYKLLYHEAISTNKKIRTYHFLTLGTLQWMGNFYLYKWRKRQMRLAKLYWTNSPACFSLQKKIDHKKKNLDRLIIRNL